jgi:protein-tyrosine phosphatase
MRLFGKRPPKVGVLFVCMGNICRSPTAEGVFRAMARDRKLERRLDIDSAGTHANHEGEPPDLRSIETAARRNYDLRKIRARKVTPADFASFRYILAMDSRNLKSLEAIRPEGFDGHLGMFLDFAPATGETDVPDPYYGGPDGFEKVLDLVETASRGLLARIERDILEGKTEG